MDHGVVVQLTGWVGCLLLALLLFRGVAGSTVKQHPLFYIYVAYVLLTSIWALYEYSAPRAAYRRYYWTFEFVSLLLGYGITWEIFSKVLAWYPGVQRMAKVLLGMMLAALLLRSALAGFPLPVAVVQLERDLRAIQALFLLTLLGLVIYYSIPIGENIRGIAVGYGLFVATCVLNLTLKSYFGTAFNKAWNYGQPVEYCFSVGIWCAYLWSYRPAPRPLPQDALERDYDAIAGQAVTAMVRLRGYLLDPGGG